MTGHVRCRMRQVITIDILAPLEPRAHSTPFSHIHVHDVLHLPPSTPTLPSAQGVRRTRPAVQRITLEE